MRKILWIGIKNITVIGIILLVSFCLSVNYSVNVNFIKDLNEEINSSIERYIISDVFVMDDVNCSITYRQVHKHRLFDVRKTSKFESCNYAENRSSKGKRCKAEENKYRDVCEINSLEILNWKFTFILQF